MPSFVGLWLGCDVLGSFLRIGPVVCVRPLRGTVVLLGGAIFVWVTCCVIGLDWIVFSDRGGMTAERTLTIVCAETHVI